MVLAATAATVIASQAVISGRLLGHAPGRAARLPAAADDPPHLPPGGRPGLRRPPSTGASSSPSSPSSWASARRRRWPRPTASPSPAPWPSTRCCSSSSCATCGTSRCGCRSPAPRSSSTVDLTFFSANLTKVLHGGWFPLTIALVIFVVLTTWQRGREIVTRNRTEEEGPLRAFIEEIRDMEPARLPRAEDRHLPQRQHRDHAAGAAGQPRAQPHRPRVRRDHVDRDAEGPPRPARRARDRRRPRLPRRRDHAHDRAHRVHGQDRRPGHGAHGGRGGGGRARPRARLLLPLAHHDRADPRAGDGALAQAALRRHRAQRGQPGRALRPPRQPDRGPERATSSCDGRPARAHPLGVDRRGPRPPGPRHRRRPAPASARASTCASRTGCWPWAGRSIAPCSAARGWSRAPASSSSTPCYWLYAQVAPTRRLGGWLLETLGGPAPAGPDRRQSAPTSWSPPTPA